MFKIFGDELDDIYYVKVIVLVRDSGKSREIKRKPFARFLPTFNCRNLYTEVKSLPFKPADDVSLSGKRS